MNETNDFANQLPVKCEICGRQDDTVRFVTYPYVFSFVVVTFQRAFTGCWCRLHRIQRWFAASIITSIFGWLGIPFGIVLTPMRLLQLARGGFLENNVNGQILRTIGEQKLQNGDTQGAIRCFEASMIYVDDQWVNEHLRSLHRTRAMDNEAPSSGLVSMFVFPLIAIVLVLIGMFVGVVDFIVRWFSSFLPPELSIFVLILLQLPFVILVYFSVSFLSHVFQSVIRLIRISSVSFLSIAGLVISLLFINGIVSGGAYGQYFAYFVNDIREQPDEVLTTLTAILTRGGPYIFSPAFFASNFFGSALFAVLIFLSFVLFILVLMPKVKSYAAQQDRIARLKGTDEASSRTSPMFGWIGLVGLIIVFALLFVAAPQKSSIDTLEAFDHVGSGFNYMALSQPDKGIAEYQAAIELKPRFVLAHILLGNAYLSLGEADKSQDSFLTAATLEPENPIIHSGLGWSYYQQGKNELAESKFLEALGFDAQNLDAHLGLGWVYLQEEDYDLAGRKFNDALSIDNQNLSGHLGLGYVYLYEFDLENGRKEFEYVNSIAPEFAEAYIGLGALELSVYDFDSSIELMDEALRLNSNLPGAYYFKGLAYYRQGKYSDAEAAFQSALNILPNDYDVLNGLGDVRVANYEFEEGVDYYDNAIATNPERVDAHLNKAIVLYHMGKFDEALSLLEPFAEKDARIKPIMAHISYLMGNAIAGDIYLRESVSFVDVSDQNSFERSSGYFTIAAVEYSLTDFTQAERYSELAVKNYPIEIGADSYFFLARIYSALGEFNRARAALDSGENIGHSEVLFHYARAELLMDQEKLDEAEQELLSAIKIDDRSSNVHVALSFIHYQQGDLPRAVVDVKKALQFDPYNSYAHTQLAYVYQAQGRIDEALVEAQEAVRLNTLGDTSHYILGVCYMESGKPEDAIREFEKFLDLYWDRAYVREYKVNAEEYLEQLRQSP